MAEKVLTDAEISQIMPKTFGDDIDNNVEHQRSEIVKSLSNKQEGYWVGKTIFNVLVRLNLIEDGMSHRETKITERGERLLAQELG